MAIEGGRDITKWLAAIILAAGYSSRMKQNKMLMSINGEKIIESAIQCFQDAGVQDINVIVGHYAHEVTAVVKNMKVNCVYNHHYNQGMFSSIVTGIQALRPGTEAFFLLPGDIPLVRANTILRLCHAYRDRNDDTDIIYPVFSGQRGHPPLISKRCFSSILSTNCQGGLREILTQYEKSAYNLEVLDERILLDLDTTDDYRELVKSHDRNDIPSRVECFALLKSMEANNNLVDHCSKVADVAGEIAYKLQQSGLTIDAGLVVAAGQVHDVAKGMNHHAQCGADILRKLGYPKVADLIALHTDLEFSPGSQLNEAAIVYLADKLVAGNKIVDLDRRFQTALTRYCQNSEAEAAIYKRYQTAKTILLAIENRIGENLSIIKTNREEE
jgi:CTP:molybdopterin cytidylyltransferase MocA/HD superfamily phosphodiesterase